MKKRIVTICLVAALLATCFAGTYAYLTDIEAAKNVMVLGNVDIEQKEYQRVVENNNWVTTGETDAYGYIPDAIEAYDYDGKLAPAVYADGKVKWDDRNGSESATGAQSYQQSWAAAGAPGSNQLFDDSVKNVVDKFVFVTNTGNSDVYFRTIVLIEAPESVSQGLIHDNFNNNTRYDYNGAAEGRLDAGKSEPHGYTPCPYVTVDGVRYYVVVATHTEALKSGDTARPSLLQLYLDPAATNADCEEFGDSWDVLVLSQAVQADGFADAQTALDTAFGVIDADTLNEWF